MKKILIVLLLFYTLPTIMNSLEFLEDPPSAELIKLTNLPPELKAIIVFTIANSKSLTELLSTLANIELINRQFANIVKDQREKIIEALQEQCSTTRAIEECKKAESEFYKPGV